MEEGLERAPDPAARNLRAKPVDLEGSARRGIVLTSGSTGSRTVLELLTSILLARLLEPHEFGIVAVAATFLGLSFVIGNFGVGIAVVQARTLDSKDRNTAFFLASGVGLLFTLALSAIGPVAAGFFEMPVLKLAMPVMSLQILLSSAAATPIALLRRKLQFGRAALVDLLGSLSYGITSVGLALLGFGVWSLVWAPVVAGSTTLLLACALSRFLPGWSLSGDAARRLLRYGGALTVKNVFVHISRHADKFIIAKLLGAHATGLYARAFNWGSIPDMRLMPVLQTVCFPVFCRLVDDRERFIEWYVKVATLGAMAMVPVSLGLLVLADDFTVAVFGLKWRGIVASLRILCVVGLLNSLNRLAGAAMEATGKLRLEVLTQTTYAVLLVVGAILAIPYGIESVSWAVLAATVVLFVLKGESLRRVIGLPLVRYLGIPVPSLGAGLVMVASVYGVLAYAGLFGSALGSEDHWLRLMVGAVVGACVYPLALYVLARRHFHLLVRQLPQLLSRPPGDVGEVDPGRGVRTVVFHGHSPYDQSIYKTLYEAYARRLRVIYVYADPGKWSLRGALTTGAFREFDFAGAGPLTLRLTPPLPGSRLGGIASINRWLSLGALLRYLRRHVDPDAVLVTQQPALVPTFRGLPAFRVYEVIDDYVGLQIDAQAARTVQRAHRRALRQCDLVWATAGVLVEAIREVRPDVVETTNGVDYELFSRASDGPVPEALARIPGPVVGLIGRLNDRIDWTLLEEICGARTSWSVVVVGPLYGPMKDTRQHLARLARLPNFHHLPAVSEDTMPSHIAGFDVCLIPYHPTGSNLSVNPLKLYQYLAVGKPVIATRIPALSPFANVIAVREGSAEFIAAIEAALGRGGDAELVRQRRERARQFDWQAVADSQIAVLEQRLRGTSEAAEALGELRAR